VSNDSGVIENVDFRGYSITQSLVAFPLTPKYMTLSDLDWLLHAKICFRAGLAG